MASRCCWIFSTEYCNRPGCLRHSASADRSSSPSTTFALFSRTKLSPDAAAGDGIPKVNVIVGRLSDANENSRTRR